MDLEHEFRTRFREGIRLLMKALKAIPLERSVAWPFIAETSENERLRNDISCYFQNLKKLKNGIESDQRKPFRSAQDCPHDEPERHRRILGNGAQYVWRCPSCWSYLKPIWESITPPTCRTPSLIAEESPRDPPPIA